MTKTPKFQPPSIQEAHLHGIKIDLPEVEVEKFMAYFESNGWKVGKVKMQNWHSAMGGWKFRYNERKVRDKLREQTVSPNVQLIQWRHELDRVEAEMKRTKGACWTQNNGWDDEESRLRHRDLRTRRDELLKKLNMVV